MKRITLHVLQNINNAEKGDRNISEKSVDYDGHVSAKKVQNTRIQRLMINRMMKVTTILF